MDAEYSFGLWIRKRRTALGLTQAALAQQVGYSAAMLRKIENDERRPTRQAAVLLAHALRIAPEQHAAFLEVARQERAVDRLGSPADVALLPGLTLAQPRTNLPVPSTLFIGREAELARLANLLEDPTCRLVTVIGLAGTGKTRLALQAAYGQRDHYAHGVFFVPLAPLTSPAMLVGTVAQAIGFRLHGVAEPETQLLLYLREKHLLLVLDNFEHLLEGTSLLATILEAAPGLQLLVTSRERLNLQVEWALELEGLPYPLAPDGQDQQPVETYGAVQLFLRSALRVNPNFTLSDENRDCVVRVCQLMEGLPLGLELAAAWIRALPCQAIVRACERSLDLLKATARDIPERHRSLRLALDHSWNLLSARERAILQRLSVFRGGFSAEAGQAVVDASLEDLTSLMDKSLLKRVGEERYDLHELVRQYAGARLQSEPSALAQARDRHCGWYAARLAQWGAQIRSPRQMAIVAEMEAEVDNVRQAWSWMVDHQQATRLGQSLRGLWQFHEVRARFQEGATLLEQARVALQAPGEPDAERAALLGRVLAQLTYLSVHLDRREAARGLAAQSLALVRAGRNSADRAEALGCLAFAHYRLGEYEAATQNAQEGLDLYRALQHPAGIAFCLISLSYISQAQSAYDRAYAYSRESLALCRDVLGDPHGTADSLLALSYAARYLHHYVEARQWAEQALEISQSIDDRWSIALALRRLGQIDVQLQAADRAQGLLRQSVSLFREIGDGGLLATALIDLGVAARAAGQPLQAKEHFRRGLRTALDTQTADTAVWALVELALAGLQSDSPELALAVAAFCLQHPGVHPEVKRQAEQLWGDLQRQLSPQQFETIQGQAQRNTLESLAQEVLAAAEPSPAAGQNLAAPERTENPRPRS